MNYEITKDLVSPVIALKGNPHWEEFIAQLKLRNAKLAFTACGLHDETLSRWAQGRCQELSNLLSDVVEQAEAHYEALRAAE